jgi:transcriptional regulator with XRE-family HTH domain
MLRMDLEATLKADTGGPRVDFPRTFGTRLTELRGAKGWKQRELSRRAGIDPGRLSRMERGVARVTVAELIRLSSVLSTGLDQLIFGAPAGREGEGHRLLAELERIGPPANDCGLRLLQALVLTYQPSQEERP